MKKAFIVGLVSASVIYAQGADQPGTHQVRRPMAKVEVVAFEAGGRFLGSPNVSVFAELDYHQNLAGRFRSGVATDVPYGSYRIEGSLPWYYSDVGLVRVYQPVVTVVLGLRFAAELPEIPPSLRGRVTGLSAPLDKTFVRLIGVYEHVSIESAIDRDRSFSLGGLSPGLFLLLVVGEKRVLASRTVTIPYTGPPFEINVGGEPPAASQR